MNRQLVWLFDLDNTLHNASHAIFPAINGNMNALIERVLAASELPSHPEAVNALRIRYWQRYGATLLGMIRHHGVRADDFLRDAHQFENLPGMIRAERGIVRLLRRLPGRKILLTNAPRAYAKDVVRHLGLQRHFALHVPIEAMRVHRQWRPKPSTLMLRQLLRRQRLSPARCVLVEDSVDNLRAAKSLGLRTVCFTGFSPPTWSRPGFVDVQVKSLHQLPKRSARWR